MFTKRIGNACLSVRKIFLSDIIFELRQTAYTYSKQSLALMLKMCRIVLVDWVNGCTTVSLT